MIAKLLKHTDCEHLFLASSKIKNMIMIGKSISLNHIHFFKRTVIAYEINKPDKKDTFLNNLI